MTENIELYCVEPFTLTKACLIKINSLGFLLSNILYKAFLSDKFLHHFYPVHHIMFANTDYFSIRGYWFANMVENEQRGAIRFEAGECIVCFKVINWEWQCK